MPLAPADPPAVAPARATRRSLVIDGPCWVGSGKIAVDGAEYCAARGLWQSSMRSGAWGRVSCLVAWCGSRPDPPPLGAGEVADRGLVAIRDPSGGGVECRLWSGAGLIELEFDGSEVCAIIVR